MVKNNETNDKFYRKVAFPRYTESVKFMSQSRETASKLKPHRGLGTRLNWLFITCGVKYDAVFRVCLDNF